MLRAEAGGPARRLLSSPGKEMIGVGMEQGGGLEEGRSGWIWDVF